MGGGIYLIQGEDRLVEMTEQAYDSEYQLQDLLEKYPNLLAGDQIGRATPRRWLSISREMAVPAEEDGTSKWPLEHLFFDQDGIPTLVEVKSTSSADIRRKVVGRMLDYAANALLYWPVESMIAQFESNCSEVGRDPEEVFEEFLGADANEERFWQRVKTNLQAGKLRLVFVAEEVNSELRRVVEFLNEQMDPIEVLAVEIKQYVSQDGLRTLVPRLIGQTAEAQQKKSSATRERKSWDEVSFFKEFQVRQGSEEADMAREIYEWALEREVVEVQWGRGGTYGGFSAKLKQKGRRYPTLFLIDIAGEFQIYSRSYASIAPFDVQEKWLELRSRMSSIGLSLPIDPNETRLPNFRMSSLQDEDGLKQVMETFDWVIMEIKASSVN